MQPKFALNKVDPLYANQRIKDQGLHLFIWNGSHVVMVTHSETRDRRPETRDQRPETRDQRTETRDQRPETKEQRLETRDQRPKNRD
ncbi:hypothetical protein EYF80_010779 [Liparis tanakae]|uniref:Uncharacterized protein n=1 Tax=Liparis tanakae TaxID=230148 RepID=A0A4Z2IM25_9TELE|nr:hypothetical protein EYF80_010779 [Liparis tanakae]